MPASYSNLGPLSSQILICTVWFHTKWVSNCMLCGLTWGVQNGMGDLSQTKEGDMTNEETGTLNATQQKEG